MDHFPEANTARIKITHIRTLATALETTAHNPTLELRILLRTRNY